MSDNLASTMTIPITQATAAQPELGASVDHDALLPGTRLGEFEIIRLLGAGGFGIVYLALDTVLLRHVAIKEYMPIALAGRSAGAWVSMRSPAHAETFALGLESFFNEARLLASFDHPALVKVHRVWKANGTAYIVMPYYQGRTLKEARRAMSAPPDEAWLRAVVEPLLGALELLHREGVYHRDIAPDNILLQPDGRPVLLDFGAARRAIGDRTQSLTAVLKPNFAPVEQYADVVGMRQGPWTDLYALGATLHFMLTGEAPAPAVIRAVRDAMPSLSAHGGALFPGVASEFLATIDWTLALAPRDRPQSVASVRQALSGEVVPPPPSPRHAIEPRPPYAAVNDEHARLEVALLDTAVAALPAGEIVPVSMRAASPAASARRGRGTHAALALTVLAVLGWSAQTLSPSTPVPSDAARAAVARVFEVAPSAIAAPTAATARRLAPPAFDAVANSRRAAVAAVAKVPPSASAPMVTPRRGAAEAPTSTTLRAADAGPRSPKAACGDLNFFALAVCVSRICQTRRWQAHPQCVEPRLVEEQRQRRIDQQ
jgi:serine/threonine protein kinase